MACMGSLIMFPNSSTAQTRRANDVGQDPLLNSGSFCDKCGVPRAESNLLACSGCQLTQWALLAPRKDSDSWRSQCADTALVIGQPKSYISYTRELWTEPWLPKNGLAGSQGMCRGCQLHCLCSIFIHAQGFCRDRQRLVAKYVDMPVTKAAPFPGLIAKLSYLSLQKWTYRKNHICHIRPVPDGTLNHIWFRKV